MFGNIGFYEIITLFIVLGPYLLLCYAAGRYAKRKRRSQSQWTILAVFLSPVLAFILLLAFGEGNEISA